MGKKARVFLAVMMISMAFGAYGVDATSRDIGASVTEQSGVGTSRDMDESVTVRPGIDEEDKTSDKEKEEEKEDDKDLDEKRGKDVKNEVSLDLDESKSYIYGIDDKDKFSSKAIQLYNSNGKEAIKVRLPIGCENLSFISSDYGVFTGKDEDHPVCISTSAVYGKLEGTDALEKVDVDSLLFDVVVVQSKNYDNLTFDDKFESYEEMFSTQRFKKNFKKSSIKSIEIISGVYKGLEYKSMLCNFKDGSTAFSPYMYVKMTNTQWLEFSSANINEKDTMDKEEVERIWSTILDYVEL